MVIKREERETNITINSLGIVVQILFEEGVARKNMNDLERPRVETQLCGNAPKIAKMRRAKGAVEQRTG